MSIVLLLVTRWSYGALCYGRYHTHALTRYQINVRFQIYKLREYRAFFFNYICVFLLYKHFVSAAVILGRVAMLLHGVIYINNTMIA